MAAAAKVKSIFVYPIKSCRGISVAHQAPITPTVVKAPGMEVLKVPLMKSTSTTITSLVVGEWCGSALDEGDVAAQWFSNYLGKQARLLRFNDASEVRTVDRGYKVMFSDHYPFLLLSQGSLNALNARLKEPVPVNRFRPNILVDGCEPFSEDLWTDMRINDSTFQGVKLCSRGKVPTINQETGVAAAASEITHTLTTFRSDKALQLRRPNNKHNSTPGKVYFGLNLVCNSAKGNSIKVGDPVFVLKMVSSAAHAAAA
ncbi:hypothetical protein C2S51_037452 [Perilla frutescens var. frutescens]|nr:hypothetical protein C2S51_037452 [Perilla frutescens var. frutescens]